MMLGAIQSQMLIGKRIKHWSPADLFANGEQGALWGPLPYYSDAAGTVEADWGDPVGLIPDASGNEQNWTQVTSTARPILGRVPVGGRRNLLTYTEDFGNAVWVPQRVSVTVNATTAPDGELTADRIIENTATGQHSIATPATNYTSGIPVVYSVSVKASGREMIIISTNVYADFGGVWRFAVFNLSSSEVVSQSGVNSASIESLGDGWYRCTVSATPVASGSLSPFALKLSDGTASQAPSYAGDGTSGIYIWGIQLETGSVATPYQRVGNEYDITEAGVKGIHYLRFDGTDDSEPTTLPAISGGTIVLAGVNGIWIDEIDFAGGAFSVGPGTYTDGPTGLMSILGDILVGGGFVIDRALTPEEVAQVERYYKARGSAGLIELGPEMVVNGTFDTDVSGWSGDGGPTWENGAARSIVNPASFGGISGVVSPPAVAGLYYLAGLSILENSGNTAAFRLRGTATNNPRIGGALGVGLVSQIVSPVTGTSGTVDVYNNNNATSNRLIDNVSLRRLIMPGETP